MYEQAISLNQSYSATLKSICDITAIRILERDIYLAYYTLDRVEDIPVEMENMYNLKLFLDGAVNMIKKKYKEGLEILNKVTPDKLHEPMVRKILPSYVAYGKFCSGQLE